MLLDSDPTRWQILDSVDSTNRYASEADELPSGTVIFAREQKSGRGRRGRDWVSRPGESIIFSGVLQVPESFAVERIRYLPLLSGFATLKACQAVLPNSPHTVTGIKWPNDIYLIRDGRPGKAGGVLIESTLRGRHMRVVIGIGLNYRGPAPELHSSRALATPVSLLPDASEGDPIFDFGPTLVASLNSYLVEFLSEDSAQARAHPPAFLTELRKYDLLRDQIVEIEGQSFRAIGIDDQGELALLDPASGREFSIDDTTRDLRLPGWSAGNPRN